MVFECQWVNLLKFIRVVSEIIFSYERAREMQSRGRPPPVALKCLPIDLYSLYSSEHHFLIRSDSGGEKRNSLETKKQPINSTLSFMRVPNQFVRKSLSLFCNKSGEKQQNHKNRIKFFDFELF